MFEQIEIPKKEASIKASCDCGNTQWIESTVEIKPLIAGGLILAWEFSMGLECSKCELYCLKNIGTFDDEMNVLSDFPHSPEYVKKLRELPIKDKIFSSFQKIADCCKCEGIFIEYKEYKKTKERNLVKEVK